MAHDDAYHERRRLERLPRPELERHQLSRLNALLDHILPANKFYAVKLAGIRRPVQSLAELRDWPLTTKEELLPEEDGSQPSVGGQPFVGVQPSGCEAASPQAKARIPEQAKAWAPARHLTYPIERYLRFHQTSGTRGQPLVVPDDAEGWRDWVEGWQWVLDAAGLRAGERALLAFSFGPFVGFWSAFDAVLARGGMAIPGGGMSTAARLDLLRRCPVAAVFCTPSYALHMAETAAAQGIDLPGLGVRSIIVAGEPGGSIPATRARIESAWGATLIDHAGATEVGPWGYADAERRGLHVNEANFIAEFLSLDTGQPASEGELAELVLTNLGRPGTPVIRYRTGDLVRPVGVQPSGCEASTPRTKTGASAPAEACTPTFVLLEGGVLGRADDMLIIRGVNVYPSAVEHVLRGFPEIAEFRLTAYRQGQLDELRIEIEDAQGDPQRVAAELLLRLGLRIEVQAVPSGTLPRFEAKARRFVDLRGA
jgi:phenylacetate-CoA ligase